MLVNIYQNPFLSPKRLDRFLLHGWFRNCNILTKQKIVCVDNGLSAVINIRVLLENYTIAKSLQKMYRRNMAKFRCEIHEVRIDASKEVLYQNHKSRFKGAIMPTLENTLFGYEGRMYSPFHTHELCVYDENKLVAVSYFDVSHNSIASILGLFDTTYHKYSLGMFTMLLEIDLAQRLHKKYYYPGYILHKDSAFDYKLRLGNIQYHDGKNYWKSHAYIDKETWLDTKIDLEIHKISQQLHAHEISFHTWLNPYFQLGYFATEHKSFLESPVHFICLENPEDFFWVIEYMPDRQTYRLSKAEKFVIMKDMQKIIDSLGQYNTTIYNKNLLVYCHIIIESANLDEVINTFLIEKILLK
jgi:arginyl-tRNA--protein-N-Asp/Glu arginylyltransferase